jgi:type IV pilus assembly protein PilE
MNLRHARPPSRGFTLIELMITVAVIGILAAIAYPSYADYVRKSKRAMAQAALMELGSKEQAYLLDRRAYTATLADMLYSPPKEIENDYAITLVVNNAATPPTFTATATPQGAQTKDKCGTMTLNQAGTKTAGGTGCW